MALLHLDGFDGASASTGTAAKTDTVAYLEARYITPSWSGNGPFVFGGWGGVGSALSFGGDGFADVNWLRKQFTEAATIVTGFAYRPHSSTGSNGGTTIVQFRHDGDGVIHLTLELGSGSILRVKRGGTTIGTAIVSHPGRWVYIEAKVTINNSTGAVVIRANGTTVLNLSGIDTKNGGTADAVDTVELRGLDGTGTTADDQCFFDDWYILDSSGSANNDFLGPLKVEELLPDGAGDNADFTPSTGSNYQNVDETPRDDDTTYNESSTTTDLDLFTAGNLGTIDGTVYGVVIDAVGRVTDASAFTLVTKVKSSTTEGTGSGVSLTNTSEYLSVSEVFEQDPHATAAWTVSTINSMQIGYEVG